MEQPLYRKIDFLHAKIGDKVITLQSKEELQRLSNKDLQEEEEKVEHYLSFDVIVTDESIWYDINYADESLRTPSRTYKSMLEELAYIQSSREAIEGHSSFEIIKTVTPTEIEATNITNDIKLVKKLVDQEINNIEEKGCLYTHNAFNDLPTDVCSHLQELESKDYFVLFISNDQKLLTQVRAAFPTPDDESDPLVWCSNGDDIIGITKCLSNIRSILNKRNNEQTNKKGTSFKQGNNKQSISDKNRRPYKKNRNNFRSNNHKEHIKTGREDQGLIDKLGMTLSPSLLIVIILVGIIALGSLIWKCSSAYSTANDTELAAPISDLSGYYTFGEIHGSNYDNIQSAVISYSESFYILWIMADGNEEYHNFQIISGDTLKSETLGTGIVQRDDSGKLSLLFKKNNQQWLLQKTGKK